MPMLLVLALVLLAAAAYLTGEVVTLPARQRHASIRRAATYGRARRTASALDRMRFRDRVLSPMSYALARGTLRLNPKATTESIALKLLGAGLGRKVSPQTFLAAKGACAGGGALLGLVFGIASSGAGAGFFLLLACAAPGFFVPDLLVTAKARSRREAIKAELPDALDLLAVCVEAGLGFDGAIAKLTEHMAGPLADELGLTLGEMRIGESRQDALKKFAARVATPEIAAFTRSIIQADQLGISLGRILRVQAADTRLRRQYAAEEKAMKAPIKMLFPTVLFIFPAMFIVILGPAMLQLAKVF